MSIQVEQPLQNRIMEAFVHDEAKPRQQNLSDRIDFDTVYALVCSMTIWGCFILTLWSLT